MDLPHLRKRQRKSEMFSVAIILKENRGEEASGKRGLAEKSVTIYKSFRNAGLKTVSRYANMKPEQVSFLAVFF